MQVDHELPRVSLTGLALLAVIVTFTAWCHLPDLDHSYLPGWDEAVHAAVAGNLSKHPGTPTLFDDPFVPFQRHDWQANHVWLHMPPVPFWQSALSIGLGGRSFFFLRFPTFLLFSLTLILTYLLGLRLYGEPTGLLAAGWMAVCPFAWLQVQGYHFGDMTDVSLAFWLLACVAALERAFSTNRKSWAVLAGICQGFAWLTKSALALAPVGACLVLWLIPFVQSGWKKKTRWFVPAIVLGLSCTMALVWRIYSSVRWPVEFGHEQKSLWLHVTTSYEGHGRPWDALFNDLVANLFTPAFIIWILAGAGLLAWMAWKRKSTGIGLHALWIMGTWLPLLVVKTKVPALLFGLFPALALAGSVLIVRCIRRWHSVWASALLLTPVVFLALPDWLPGDFWRFADSITPAMAVWPHLPLQLAILLGLGVTLFLGRALWRFARKVLFPKSPMPASIWMVLIRIAVLAPMLWLLHHSIVTRNGFAIIKDYNPAARNAERLVRKLPEKASVILEGITNGRQRPDLTVAFLTGQPAHLVRGQALRRTVGPAREQGDAFLVTPVKRQGDEVAAPAPGAGYWVYKLGDSLPEPVIERTGTGDNQRGGPELVELVPDEKKVPAGSSLYLLAIWQTAGPSHCTTRTLLEPIRGGPSDDTFPRESDFPTGYEATILHTLAPPGLLWGSRPLGTGLVELHRMKPGNLLADDFMIWVPRHLDPGKYRVRLILNCSGRVVDSGKPVSWPVIEVTR